MGTCNNNSNQRHREIQKIKPGENNDSSQINNVSKNNQIINEKGMIQVYN